MIERSRRVATACVERERGLQSSCRGCWLEGVIKGAEQSAKCNRETVLIFKKQAPKEQNSELSKKKTRMAVADEPEICSEKFNRGKRGSQPGGFLNAG